MSNIRRNVRRFRKIGAEEREDLDEFIKYGQMGQNIKIPIKVVNLPEFRYLEQDKGGIGQGDVDEGDELDDGKEGEEPMEPGDETDEHEYYEMDPEDFSEELSNRLGLEFEDKGKKVTEEAIGSFNETARSGPESAKDVDYLFKKAIQRYISMYADEDYIKKLLQVRGFGVESVWKWAMNNSMNISKGRIKEIAQTVDNRVKYDSVDDIDTELNRKPPKRSFHNLKFRREDERYRAPVTKSIPTRNAVVINIRDVSSSMKEDKRELVERVFTPLDWFLQGQYENTEFVYIVHDAEAWEVEREKFFGIKSGGGTKVSTSYNYMMDNILEEYPWKSWNRYIFFSGDGENKAGDTINNLVPAMRKINATRQAYVEVSPSGNRQRLRGRVTKSVASTLNESFDNNDNIRVTTVTDVDDVMDALETVLYTVDTQEQE